MSHLSPEEYRRVVPSEPLNSAATTTRLSGKVAIVTGGSCGIGRSIVERLSNDGASVAIFDIDEEFGLELSSHLESEGKNVKFYNVDVSQRDQCERNARLVAKENGEKINYLVNCAAYFGSKGIDATDADWNKTLSVNVVGYANTVQACHPYMKNGGDCNAIVHISSISAHVAQPKRWTYSAAKGAVNIMTKCMAMDLAKDGIRVNSVSPGYVWTREQWKVCQGDRTSFEAKCSGFQMNKKFVETEGVAAAVAFLCSEDAKYINGSDLPVDSGYQAMGPDAQGDELFAGCDY